MKIPIVPTDILRNRERNNIPGDAGRTGKLRKSKRGGQMEEFKLALHEIFQVHYIHEVLHLLSGVVGSFFGTWAYFASVHRRRKMSE
jgi:hypothetical protein